MKTRTLEAEADCAAMAPLRVLMVEHDGADADLILRELKIAGVDVEPRIAVTREEFRRLLDEWECEAVISDYRLAGWTGLDALKEMHNSGKDVPFLLITGTLGEEAAVECIKQGVSDYVLKNRLSRLPHALARAIREKRVRTERLQAEAALADSEAKVRKQFAELELLYRNSPVCLAVLDRELKFVRVNDAMAQNHGMSPAEHIGKSLVEVVPEVAEEARALYNQVFSTGEAIHNVERRVKRTVAPFEARDYLASLYPLKGADGEAYAACVVMMDITERKRVEEELRLSEAHNRELVENSSYGIFRVSPDGVFLDANPALLTMLGVDSRKALEPVNFARDIFRFPEQYAQIEAECRKQGYARQAEAEWRRRDGGTATVRLHVRQASAFGMEDVLEVIAEDVTELRMLDRQLRQAQKFEAIGQLAGGIAHDFNNVVGAILGWAELGIDQNQTDSRAAEKFRKIKEQAERAAALTKELLAFARRQVLQPQAVDLNEVTSGLMNFLDRVIKKDIEIKIISGTVDPVKADPTQIEQVLINLCVNARDAMPDGGRLQLETEMAELDDSYCRFYPGVTAGRYAVISVSDTGIGMDAGTREHIFEPFFTTKEKGKGTGLGLATVYGIVKQHGGFVHVYSEPGQGSLFRVYLPAMEGPATEGASTFSSVPSLGELRGGEVILIAEDHESVREMARQALVNLGYRVLAAENGEEALQLCAKEAPAIAILDVVMPKLGGPATAQRLAERFAKLPILFTSGYSTDMASLAPASEGAKFLQKPYNPAALARLVREMLDAAKSMG